jgi:hypothetical protein
MEPGAKCAKCGRVIALVPGDEVCRTCARLRDRPRFGPLALLATLALSVVPIGGGLILLMLKAPRSQAMTLLYAGSGLMFMSVGPLLSLHRGLTRGGPSGVLTALAIAVLTLVVGWALIMIDFFGIVGDGWQRSNP